MKPLEEILERSIQRRRKMGLNSDALRLVNGIGDGLDGLLIDRYNRHLHIQVLSKDWHEHKQRICRFLASFMPIDYMIIKFRQGLNVRAEVVSGQESRTIVEEHGLKFEVDLNDGLNCGLFLDMRKNRRIAGEASQHAKVLNCFSYTCSFGAYARHGGAREVINTDISRKVLERGEKNYQLNGLTAAGGEFVKADSVSFLKRAFKKGYGYDVIILDPPSFARHGAQVFQVKRDLPPLMALAVAVLNPGGRLLVTTNYSAMGHADLEKALARGLNGRKVNTLERVGQDEDFTGTNSFKESFLVGVWVKFL